MNCIPSLPFVNDNPERAGELHNITCYLKANIRENNACIDHFKIAKGIDIAHILLLASYRPHISLPNCVETDWVLEGLEGSIWAAFSLPPSGPWEDRLRPACWMTPTNEDKLNLWWLFPLLLRNKSQMQAWNCIQCGSVFGLKTGTAVENGGLGILKSQWLLTAFFLRLQQSIQHFKTKCP